MFRLDEAGISNDERALRKSRGELYASRIGTGYVAVTEDGDPAYCQWLIGPEFNALIADFFDGVFPRLELGEALLEGAFTPEAHRGKGIMPAAMARIAEHGHDIGAGRVITFVTSDNIPSIKGCERSGFAPYTTRHVIWNGLRRSVTFTPRE
jgi:RimJ/RimL family protein N-acetyltransferase